MSNVMTSARTQKFCRKNDINNGYYDGFRVCPRNITEIIIALKIQINHFCLIWKSKGISFNQVIEKELKPSFRVVDIIISDKQVKIFIKTKRNLKKFNLYQLTWLFMI